LAERGGFHALSLVIAASAGRVGNSAASGRVVLSWYVSGPTLGLTVAYRKADGSEATEGNLVMTAASRPQVVTLRSGDVVRLRQVDPGDAPALARAYANLGEQSRYRRFFTVMPELPEATLKAAVEVDHADHEALVAVPLLSSEIVGECRFIRRADQPDTADAGVTVIDAWQGRGLGSALLTHLSERALEVGSITSLRRSSPRTGPCSRSCPAWAGSRPNHPAPW
jgi:GNAT superfamily N-acetyltransferase